MRKAEKGNRPLHKIEAHWRKVDRERDISAEVEDARVSGGTGATKNQHAAGTQGMADKPAPPPRDGEARDEE